MQMLQQLGMHRVLRALHDHGIDASSFQWVLRSAVHAHTWSAVGFICLSLHLLSYLRRWCACTAPILYFA